MLPENITCAFKNKASFQKLEIKFGFSYYPGARKKNWDFISNLIARDLSDKIEMYSTHNEGTLLLLRDLSELWMTKFTIIWLQY